MQNTCRELVKNLRITGNNERSLRNLVRHFAIFETTSAATNIKLLNQGAAVCAPHGAKG
jgi:hypothetical protein